MLHRARDLLMRRCTQLINALRAHLTEFGIAAAQGREGIKELLAIVAQDEGSRFALAGRRLRQPARTSAAASGCADADRIARETDRYAASLDEASKRLETILGIGISGATMIAAVIPDRRVFRSLRRRLSSNAADADSSIPS